MTSHANPPTVIRRDTAYQVAFWLLWPAAGAALGAGLSWVLDALAGVDRLPVPGWLAAAADLAAPWDTVVLAAAGVVIGLLVAAGHQADLLVVEVDDTAFTVRRDTEVSRAARDEVTAVYRDGDALVALGARTEELVRVRGEVDESGLAAALRRHGYPWLPDGDPHRAAYRIFVPDSPEVPPLANAILKARATALRKGRGKEAAALRRDLPRADVVVRDEKSVQYWRAVG